jgi:sugar phosphate isomerase/epimerase
MANTAELPLSYCTNVHPCRDAADVAPMLDRYTLPVRAASRFEIAAGLWLPATAIAQVVASPTRIAELSRSLELRGLNCYTLNAFPFGDFHSERVKENVYLPDWADPRRREYTFRCATVLAGLLGELSEGSISTLPLGFKGFGYPPAFFDAAIAQLLGLAEDLDRLARDTGKWIRLALEPEPFCLFETTAETIAFFERLFRAAEQSGRGMVARRHLGVCYDVCHQAVEFEDAAAAIQSLTAVGIRINKVQVSCAVEVPDPRDPAQREALRKYVEPRYLHQTMGRCAKTGEVARLVDLTAEFLDAPPPEFLDASPWRVHFHVPVDVERLGVLRTTRQELERALGAIRRLDYAPHLEVETYTWPVMPGADPVSLVDGLARELTATRELLAGPLNA